MWCALIRFDMVWYEMRWDDVHWMICYLMRHLQLLPPPRMDHRRELLLYPVDQRNGAKDEVLATCPSVCALGLFLYSLFLRPSVLEACNRGAYTVHLHCMVRTRCWDTMSRKRRESGWSLVCCYLFPCFRNMRRWAYFTSAYNAPWRNGVSCTDEEGKPSGT